MNFLSDIGVVMILQGRFDEARETYLRIEQAEPNRYATASNLGTAYELLGDNQSALVWIKKAIEINPSSHRSSEWIHVRILEAKINTERPITSDSLINTSFGTDPSPTTKLTSEEMIKLRDAIYFQLNERVSFIKPPDKIIANLMFDLANLNYLLNSKNDALTLYEIARNYGFTDTLLQSRIENARGVTLTEKPPVIEEPKTKYGPAWMVFGVAALFLALLAAMVLRRRFR